MESKETKNFKTSKPHLRNVLRLKNPEGDRHRFVRFDKNERTTDFPEKNWKEIVDGIKPWMLTTYPENNLFTRELGEWLGGIPSEWFFLSAGSDLAIKACFESFVSPGNEVVYSAPTFAMVGVYCKLFQASERGIDCENDLTLNPVRFMEAITPNTSFVYLANPNSPSGKELPLSEIKKIVAHCAHLQIPILIDEAYYYFTATTAAGLVKNYSNLAVCRTFSKACGLAGLRLGYTLAQPNLIEMISKWRPMYEVNSLSIYLGRYIIQHDHLIAEYVKAVNEAKNYVYDWCKQNEIYCHSSTSNFLNVEVGENRVEPIAKACQSQGVLVRGSGSIPPLKKCIRLSLGTLAQTRPILEIIREIVRG